MNDISKSSINEPVIPAQDAEMSVENYLQITEEVIRKNYLTRLTELPVAPIDDLLPLEEDLIDNVRVFKISEMVYEKGEPITEKFTTVFNTLSTYNASVFIIMDSDGYKTDFYIGVRNNELNEEKKRSTVTLGDTLKNTLIGHFPGIKLDNVNRKHIATLSEKILSQRNVASVSVVGDQKAEKEQDNEQFVQGLEKLALAMDGRKYVGIIIAQNQNQQTVEMIRKNYQAQYTRLSPLQKIQLSESDSETETKSQSFVEMSGKQKAAMLTSAAAALVGAVGGAALGGGFIGGAKLAGIAKTSIGAVGGSMVGGQITGQLSGFINSLAPVAQISKATTSGKTTTVENKEVTDILQMLDDSIKRTKEFDSYGMWNVAGYFISDDMSASEIAASNYRSLMNGENSGREVSAINSWRRTDANVQDYNYLTTYLSRFGHPKFYYGVIEDQAITDATTWISGKELGIHMGLPRSTVSGLPVIKHAEFGKEVNTYNLFGSNGPLKPEDRMALGRVFDLGRITDKPVELDNKSLNMHTFITGSTGSGKSNAVYQMLTELHQDGIPFLVVEPAKGEYKDVFGSWPDVNVYSTNPKIAPLININPFMFPDSIHVLEHVDGLVEIFSVCWPMYDAMPAFFKDAILRSYESVGWDLGSSTFEGDTLEYPDFEVLVEQLNELIEKSDYASDIKSNYRGALITRVKSLTVGLNKSIFMSDQTPYEKLFDENCILDISRVKSNETKALIMGLMVYMLNEYRIDRKHMNNSGLKHVTVLEEAHNLLKASDGHESELIGKSVEMLTQTIAEIRTYGEGFIIVDQSPSSVDIAAIKNTNTKIVLRTPEGRDREAVGKSMGLTDDQMNEIAKLPAGVAVVYQNNWVTPVLTIINKANVNEKPYKNQQPVTIKTVKAARTNIINMLLQPWITGDEMDEKSLRESLRALDLSRKERREISDLITDYILFNGNIVWGEDEMNRVQRLAQATLGITEKDYEGIETAQELESLVASKIKKIGKDKITEICYILTYVQGGEQ